MVSMAASQKALVVGLIGCLAISGGLSAARDGRSSPQAIRRAKPPAAAWDRNTAKTFHDDAFVELEGERPNFTAAARKQAASGSVQADAASALEAMHAAAARSDGAAWADRLAPGLVWVGNETSERWDREAFLGFAAPVFARGEGWIYSARDAGGQRHVTLAPDPCGCVAWFDEVLDSVTYGTARGEGILVRDGETWRVLRYALSYPIPNELANGMTAEIKARWR